MSAEVQGALGETVEWSFLEGSLKRIGFVAPPSMSSFFSSRMHMEWLAQPLPSHNHKAKTRDLNSEGLELLSQHQTLPASELAV